MTKKSKNPMEFKVTYTGIPLECGGMGVHYFRNFGNAVKFYDSKYKERKDTPGHVIKLYDNIKNKVISQYDTTNEPVTNVKKSDSCNKPKKKKRYDVRLQEVGCHPELYPYRYFFNYDSAKKFYDEMTSLESVAVVVLYDRENNKEILRFEKHNQFTKDEIEEVIDSHPEVKDSEEPDTVSVKYESKIKKFFREIKELFTKSDSLM